MIVNNKLTPEELENVNGGVIADLGFFRVCYDEDGRIIENVGTYEEAVEMARKRGVSEEVLNKEDFYNRYPDSWARPHHITVYSD